MLFTLTEIINGHKAISRLVSTPTKLRAKIAYKLARLHKVLQKYCDIFDNTRNNMLHNFELTKNVNNSGFLVLDDTMDESQKIKLTNNFREFQKEMIKILNEKEDLDIHNCSLQIDDFVNSDGVEVDIDSSIMFYLEPFIVEV